MKRIVFFLSLVLFSMSFALDKLSNFAFNKYSQFGEDGIIEKIFEIINPISKVCIEFGAWDGFHLSNTAKLWAHEDWKGVLIESDFDKYQLLERNIEIYNCVSIHAHVGIEPTNTLEFILEKYNITDSIDLLSIDIDGNDYYIFQNLRTLRPRVIICEFNPTFPLELKIIPEYNNYMGCSVKALLEVAEQKGYQLVAMTDVNCFFVIKDEIDKFKDFEIDYEKIKVDKYIKYIVSTYSGEYKVISKSPIIPYNILKKYIGQLKGEFIEHADIYVIK